MVKVPFLPSIQFSKMSPLLPILCHLCLMHMFNHKGKSNSSRRDPLSANFVIMSTCCKPGHGEPEVKQELRDALQTYSIERMEVSVRSTLEKIRSGVAVDTGIGCPHFEQHMYVWHRNFGTIIQCLKRIGWNFTVLFASPMLLPNNILSFHSADSSFQ